MKVLLQTNSKCLDTEELLVENLLKRIRYSLIDYDKIELADLNKSEYNIKDLIPIGTIEFVTKYLSNTYKIEKENPVEIPEYLRTDEFLKRDYRITTWDKLPDTGSYFIKDVSELKTFGQVINLDYQNIKEWFEKPSNEFSTQLVLNKQHLFQVSSLFDVKSEYRVYVIDNKIENICNYNGDCTLLPDINLIKKAVELIKFNEKWLTSYMIDIMVGKEGTAIIEIHNFASVGLYSTLWGNNLIYAYRDGIDYLVNDNKQLKL